MPFGFGNQFQKLGYRTLAYHDYLYTYYDRNLSHPNMGYEYYGIGNGLELEQVQPPSDREMMENIVPQFVNEDQFMVYILTVSGHLNYTREENAQADRHYDEVADLPYSEPVKCYLASQMELELAIESLMDQLEAAGKLDDTVIVLSADHYPYGLTDEEYSELFGHTVDPVFEIYENSLILWSADLEEPVHVDKYCSSLDVMPTLANLFGLEYDSRLMAGRDILSDEPGPGHLLQLQLFHRPGGLRLHHRHLYHVRRQRARPGLCGRAGGRGAEPGGLLGGHPGLGLLPGGVWIGVVSVPSPPKAKSPPPSRGRRVIFLFKPAQRPEYLWSATRSRPLSGPGGSEALLRHRFRCRPVKAGGEPGDRRRAGPVVQVRRIWRDTPLSKGGKHVDP